jgi:hypothetical protein
MKFGRRIIYQKQVFLRITVHSVHHRIIYFIFSWLQGEYTVKSEQWIVHP